MRTRHWHHCDLESEKIPDWVGAEVTRLISTRNTERERRNKIRASLRRLIHVFGWALALWCGTTIGHAQSTAFTYQGRLSEGGTPATGIYDLRFTIYDFAGNTGGNVIAGPLMRSAVAVNDGLFTVTLDFGTGVFDGNAQWLEIGVRTNGSATVHQRLLPRQPITAAPYAIQSAGISGTLPDAQLSANIARLNGSNHFAGPVTFGPASGSPFAIAGSSSNKVIRGLNADKLNGKSSTDFVAKAGDTMTGSLNLPANGLAVGGSQLVVSNGNVGIGTTSPRGKLHVAGSAASGPPAAIYLEDTAGDLDSRTWAIANAVGGSPYGTLGFHVGAAAGDLPSASPSMVIDKEGRVGIGTPRPTTTLHVAGDIHYDGRLTKLDVEGDPVARIRAFDLLFGLSSRSALTDMGSALGVNAVGGWPNTRLGGNVLITQGDVGIGTENPQARLHVAGDIQYDGRMSKLDVAQNPVATIRADELFFGSIGSPGRALTDMGFALGINEGSGWPQTRLGGNVVIPNGRVGIGTASPAGLLAVGNANQFTISENGDFQASGNAAIGAGQIGGVRLHIGTDGFASLVTDGNVGIGTSQPAGRLHTVGGIAIASPFVSYGAGGDAGARSGIIFGANHPVGNAMFWMAPDSTTGQKFNIGTGQSYDDASTVLSVSINGTVRAQSFVPLSDRNVKSAFASVNSREVLESVVSMPIQTWHYTNDTAKIRHIGPMAQDFHAAFGVGADDKHIATVDADGVALAAIQGLHQIVKEKETEIEVLKASVAELKSLVATMLKDQKTSIPQNQRSKFD